MVAGNVGCDARMGSQRGHAENWCPEEESIISSNNLIMFFNDNLIW
jgi:hypothetical protein